MRDDVADDARGHRHQMRLMQRAAVTVRERRLHARRDFVGIHDEVVEFEAAARGHALPHAVPVVDHPKSLAPDRLDRYRGFAVFVLHVQARVAGERGARRIKFAVAETEVIAFAPQLRLDFPGRDVPASAEAPPKIAPSTKRLICNSLNAIRGESSSASV
jgi:hypothetical protein